MSVACWLWRCQINESAGWQTGDPLCLQAVAFTIKVITITASATMHPKRGRDK
ncbi:hypothetical protein SynBIOSU31_02008 [Synechococcus sp. BIOS-U3-1]|nr:hypothetical protein SynBIOSU31_02008 [Synechococcus sp. BIOS-U3-1]